jgi:hypothetical protein
MASESTQATTVLGGASLRRARVALLACASALLCGGCGSAATDELGRCKAVDDAKFVAASTDIDGKEWTFELGVETVDVRCNSASEAGSITITGVIRDSLRAAKAGLVVRPNLSGESKSLSVNKAASDTNTDACGVASFTLNWSCPSTNKELAGSFQASSGPLFSKPVKVTIANVVVANAQSSAGGAGAGGAGAGGAGAGGAGAGGAGAGGAGAGAAGAGAAK